jgi:hypothetical protein
MYLYDSHKGGFYESEEEYSEEELYCDLCNDSDRLVGKYETEEEKEKLIKKYNGETSIADDYKGTLQALLYYNTWDCYNDEPNEMSEELEKAYDELETFIDTAIELQQDVKRYFELDEKYHTTGLKILEAQEKVELSLKLSKVGNENE